MLTRSRLAWDFILILLTAAFTGTGSWFVTHYQLSKQQDFWIQQQQMLGESKLHESKLVYLEKAQRLKSDFRSLSMIYFFADLDQQKGIATSSDREAKHNAYHKLDSELSSCLLVLPFFFGEGVKKAVDDVDRYFVAYPWESLIQNDDFKAKVDEVDRQNLPGDTVTKLVSERLRLDQYDELTNALVAAMAEEIASDFNNE
jgi:hypothetical protein